MLLFASYQQPQKLVTIFINKYKILKIVNSMIIP